MSLLSDILAPSATDKQYFIQLVRDISVRNAEFSCSALTQLAAASNSYSKSDVLPLLSKVTFFLDSNKMDAATSIASFLAHCRQVFFTESDLRPIMEILLRRPELHGTQFAAPFLALCAKSLTNIFGLVDDPMDLSVFAALAGDPLVTSFLIRATQLVPDLRVRFVFEGLLEQIMPAIGRNDAMLTLLAWVIADPTARHYFQEMRHIPALVSVLFDSNVSGLVTAVVRALLDPGDLLHLNAIQNILFDLGVPKQLILRLSFERPSDETVQNTALCFGDCIQYFAMRELPCPLDPLVGLIVDHPSVQTALLYLWEVFSISNPDLFPEDEYFLSRIVDPFIQLYLSYLAYDCHHRSSLDLSRFHDLPSHSFSLLLCLGIQRRTYIENSDWIAQSPENAIHRQLASANCFVCRRSGVPKTALVHYSSLFFGANSDCANPFFAGSRSQAEFFPQSFLVWGASFFGPVNKGRLIHATVTWAITPPFVIFDAPPDRPHVHLLLMNNRTNEIMAENDRWRAKYDALGRTHDALIERHTQLEMELIEARCLQNRPR
jgi:hypothetical protein